MLLITVLFIVSLSPEAFLAGLRKPAGCDFFTRQNASMIIGSEVTWTGSDSPDSDPKKWTCTFVSMESADGPRVYFGLHRFATPEKAHEDFETVVSSNKNHAGFERWAGVGDDAIVHTDGSNFQFVMVRKGIRSFRIKVNPAGTTSLGSVKAVARALVRKLEEIKAE